MQIIHAGSASLHFLIHTNANKSISVYSCETKTEALEQLFIPKELCCRINPDVPRGTSTMDVLSSLPDAVVLYKHLLENNHPVFPDLLR